MSYLKAVLGYKCPKCKKGDLFETKGTYRLKTMMNMRSACSVCGEDLKREPGFYFGAAYVSYALTVAIWVAVYVALVVFNAVGFIEYSFFENPWMYLTTGIVALVVLLPPVYRLSRSLWISWFVKPEKTA